LFARREHGKLITNRDVNGSDEKTDAVRVATSIRGITAFGKSESENRGINAKQMVRILAWPGRRG
jgi:hypothetical protein